MELKVEDGSCRSCMKSEEKSCMYFLFDNNLIGFLLSKCTALPVVQNDGLPDYICSPCHLKLTQCNEFRLMCTTTYEKYKTKLPIKDENSDLSVPPVASGGGEGLSTDDKKYFLPIEVSHSVGDDRDDDLGDVVKTEYLDENEDTESEEEYDMLKMENDNESSDDDDDDDEESNDNDEEYVEKKKKTKSKKPKVEKDDVKKYPCTKCDKVFNVERNLIGHLRIHDGLKPAFCHICNKSFTKWNAADIHIQYVHGTMPKSFICDIGDCKRAYRMKQTLQAHKRKAHKSPEEAANQPCVLHICEQCGKTFSSTSSLKKHSFVHSGLRPFACQICPKKYVTNHKLKEHMLRHEGIKNYVCPNCGMKKTTMHELKTHMNYHTREKSYQCHLCPAAFCGPGNRTRHINIVHNGIKKFHCGHCDRSFGKRETLKHHEMTHTGEKPHECHVCEKRFIQLVALKTHMKTHISR